MKKIFRRLIVLFVAAILSVSTGFNVAAADPVLNSRTDFMWGVNTHSNFYNIYSSANVEEQLHLMAEMGATFIRTNCNLSDLSWVDKVVRIANAYGIKVMLTAGSVTASLEEYDYNTAFQTAKMIANRYNGKSGHGKIDYIQVDNEVDVYLSTLSPNFGDGSSMSVYPKDDVERVCIQFKNFISGIRAADSDVQVVINSGWLHYGFHDWLEYYEVDYDILGLDWYTDQSGAFINQGKRPVEQAEFLYNRYGKKIIVCETNQWSDETFDETKASSWDDLIILLEDAYSYPFVIGACVYELCDEIYFEKEKDDPEYTYNREAHFGLIYADRHGNMLEPKPIYYRLKNLWGGRDVEKILYSDIIERLEEDNFSDTSSNKSSGASSATSSNHFGTVSDNSSISSNISSANTVTSSETETSSDTTISNSSTVTSTTVKTDEDKTEKFVWTIQNTISVLVAGVCILLIGGCIAFILIRRKQIKQLLIIE